ncbi:MAG: hypothetical protein QW046_06050 [Candidatus Micrarchaeaceae archaeon]
MYNIKSETNMFKVITEPLPFFSNLYNASENFLSIDPNPSNLYPQYLESHGYLDKSFGYGTGQAFNWTENGGWIGQWTCPDGKGKCFGIGLVGNINILKPIIDKYKPQALQIFFPYPKVYDENSKDTSGQLLMIFKAPTPKPIISSLPFTIDFKSAGNASLFEGKGFCNAEDWGTWSCSKEVTLNFDTKGARQPQSLILTFTTLATSTHPQTLEFYLNGHLLGTRQFTTNKPHVLSFDISKYVQQNNVLKISIPNAATPKSLGINADTRELGIGLIKASISAK